MYYASKTLLLLIVCTIQEFTLCLQVRTKSACARNVQFQAVSDTQYNKDTKQYADETKITFTIGLDETVCFAALLQKNTTTNTEVNYSLSFDDVKSIYTYKNGYTFSLGEPSIKCLCDCPGLENHCSPSRDSCKEDGVFWDSCFSYYSNHQPSKGCGILSAIGSGEVCCSVHVKKVGNTRYKAFEISTPVTRAYFSLTDPTGKRKYGTDLGSGSTIFHGDIRILFQNPGNINPITPGIYFGELNSQAVLTNVEVNGLAEWDINKLGWLKYQNNKCQFNQQIVKQAFTGDVVDCDGSDIEVNFGSKFIGNNLEDAKPLEEFHAATVSRAVRNDYDRNVAVFYRRFSKISVVISMSGKHKVTHKYSESQFQDFYGVARLDRYSNRFLNITIIRGKGTLTGTMRVGDEIKSYFDITVPQSNNLGIGLRNYTCYVQITQWCDLQLVAVLCLHDGENQNQVCKDILCNEEPLSEFEVPDSAVNYTRIDKDHFLSFGTWKKYFNPLEWMNGIGSWQEGVIMTVTLVITVALITVLVRVVKCAKCISKCINCLVWCFKQRPRSGHVVRSKHLSRDTDNLTLLDLEEPPILRTVSKRNYQLRNRLSTLGQEIIDLWRKKRKYHKMALSGRISASQYVSVIGALDDIERTITPASTFSRHATEESAISLCHSGDTEDSVYHNHVSREYGSYRKLGNKEDGSYHCEESSCSSAETEHVPNKIRIKLKRGDSYTSCPHLDRFTPSPAVRKGHSRTRSDTPLIRKVMQCELKSRSLPVKGRSPRTLHSRRNSQYSLSSRKPSCTSERKSLTISSGRKSSNRKKKFSSSSCRHYSSCSSRGGRPGRKHSTSSVPNVRNHSTCPDRRKHREHWGSSRPRIRSARAHYHWSESGLVISPKYDTFKTKLNSEASVSSLSELETESCLSDF